MAEFCTICERESSEYQFLAAEVGGTVMYCVCAAPYIIGFATVTNKELIENATIVNGETRSKEVDRKKSFITVVPYGCKRTDINGAFVLHIGEFMNFSPDDEGINDQMDYTRDRCRTRYEY